MDRYTCYSELRRHEKEGFDYVIHLREGRSGIAVIAVHGGGIEPGTFDIADAVAGAAHTFYAFRGIKPAGNARLHMTSNQFDEPKGLGAARSADTVLSIHGLEREDEIVCVGGLNENLKRKISDSLIRAGFNAEESATLGLRGISPSNICNRGRSGKGVQLEISAGLRRRMFNHLTKRSGRLRTRLFYVFVKALQDALP
ncbi:hypothetical protein DENIS_3512 [Desulfonema ishimotonii]|uniref:Replication protein n=1 Tax=Desulfonema ishimotonii TaxID=45657 RepID=A0A401G006_9BACT|nr:poly-gamma-glutamate hydrolase family protein [Desulfonema ishimotonii]GBC62540.1 hypothetical protein DENIS_3512 [Desulfonema ishimotonii]